MVLFDNERERVTERGWRCIREAEAILSRLEAQWAAIIEWKSYRLPCTNLSQSLMAG